MHLLIRQNTELMFIPLSLHILLVFDESKMHADFGFFIMFRLVQGHNGGNEISLLSSKLPEIPKFSSFVLSIFY